MVPFKDAIYPSCSVAPTTPAGCLSVGSVPYRYDIGELEVTVAQWVAFLNTVDPRGTDRHHLYDSMESASAWPRYGEINFVARARNGSHYHVAYPEWADKPYGFATFLRAARFVNSVTNGKVLSRRVRRAGGFSFVTYTVRLSRNTERGMYDLARPERDAGPQARLRRAQPERVDQSRLLRPDRRRDAVSTGNTRPTPASSQGGHGRRAHRDRVSIRTPAT